MEFIYYPQCSTCIKAMKHLEKKGVTFTKRDIVKETPSQDEMIDLINSYNQGIKPFFNTSGLVYKELNLKEKVHDMSIEEAAELLSSNGMLIKRPLLISDHQIIIGYKEDIYNQI